MDWKTYYDEHLATAQEAVDVIKSGDRVVLAHACGEPCHIVEAMVDNAEAYQDVEIVHMVAMGKGRYCQPEYAGVFRHNALFVGGSTRAAVAEGRADFIPSFFFEIPRLFETTLPVDVAMVMVSPPNEKGMCSLGVSVDYTYQAVLQAKKVIAQVNPQMPHTGAHSLVSVKEFDCIVEYEEPIIELAPPTIGEVEKAIGENCASLIDDGATLQLGIGAIPDAVLLFLKDKKDLGIHSEMISDGVVELVEAGVITNARKNFHPGKFVITFLMGTRRLYDFVDHNPNVELRPVDYVNNPFIIAQNDNLVSINSCVQVDLMGQVASESIGPKQISGVGGQVDFVRGASASKGGISIMAMPSTVKGKFSKIVPLLDEGAAITTSRNDVDYVVTEYGIAPLKGRTLKERAANLIKIAHPDFRDDLVEEFERRFKCAFA
ncbi:4-hydroxybutyrate CoA-transferase [Eubacterium aggregans]|uniref:4-hydroxybutyrate CoA-transferase n=1 Tax=Eubacterium aggregans TaxID=81409 RepID=A0A1H3WTK8_9FIRM|nr:acetyl-CoA hydrolase/transferase C-terminal domain-containing protein [Eubacterium aggregans]SDZ90485.1 4-hydroxybutyrate CoA-transferase [Eubacterium aggregans]